MPRLAWMRKRFLRSAPLCFVINYGVNSAMGAFEGSLSFKTYYVQGEPPNHFQEDYLQRLQHRFFQPLSPVGDDERSMGWVLVQDPMAEKMVRDKVFYNQFIVAGLRIDKWSIPTAWLKAKMNQRVAERYPDPERKLSKRQKNEIKLEVMLDIKQHILPTMKVIDMCWNITERKLRFWSTSKKLCEEFVEFFEDTFELTLVPDSPFMMAKDLGIGEKLLDKMLDIEPWHPSPNDAGDVSR